MSITFTAELDTAPAAPAAAVAERDFSPDTRDEYAGRGIALPDGSFPIPDKDALRRAIQAYGRAADKPAAMRHIKKRARALGATDLLPDDWTMGEAEAMNPPGVQPGTAGGPVSADGGPTGQGAPRAGPVRRTCVLAEAVAIRSADAAESVLDVTIIRPGWSLNGRYYAADVLAAAAPKLEGARAFGDHQAEGGRPERSIWDQIGYYRNVSVGEDGAIVGQLKLVGAPERKQHILDWAAESIGQDAPLIGLSINGIGRTEEGEAEGRQGEIVAELVDFESADVVTRPAAGGRFVALAASVGGDDLTHKLLAALSYDEWRQAHPGYAARLLETAPAAVDDTAAATIQAREAERWAAQTLLAEREAELATLRAEHDRLALAARADAALDGARVPFVHRSALREQMLVVPEPHWLALLEAQARLLAAAVPPPTPVRGAGPLAAGSAPRAETVAYDVPTAVDGENYAEWLVRRNGTTTMATAAAAATR